MALRERLTEEMKVAMKSRDDLRLSAIRLIRSAVKNREIELKHELDDKGVCEVIATLVKQRREAIGLYRQGGRDELAEKEEKELGVLFDFLPQQLTRVEIEELVLRTIAECGARDVKEMGKVMKVLSPQVAGRADGKTVAEVVKEKLA
jgi:uncharacterized protein